MEYTVQNLEYAVSVFYNSEQNERAQAHVWLTAAQRCHEAWSFVWELLQPSKGTEVQFFAATTLHTKLLRCWNELPPESYTELKDKILQAVFAYAKGPKIVLNRLCISLAAFILQQGTVDLATILTPLSAAENRALLLEVLTVIPEEFNSMTMGSALRVKNRIALQQACPAVLEDMLRYLQTNSKEPPSEDTVQTWCCAAQCTASWLSLGGEEGTLREEGTAIVLTDLLPLCHALHNILHVLYTHNEVISDTALEACEAVLNAIRAAGASPDADRYPAAALQLISEFAVLVVPILARDNVPNSINEELLAAIATCAVALGECHSRCLVQAVEQRHEGARQFIEILLASQSAPGHYPIHETRSQLAFGLWYTLQYQMDCDEGAGTAWRDVFTRLLTSLVLKCEAPAEEALSRDDAELLRCYRQDVADTVIYCHRVLGDWCLSLTEAAWREAHTEARREAALHVFLALADTAFEAPEPVATMLEHAVNAAATSTDTRLLNTALECLGAYSWWLSTPKPPPGLAMSALRAAGAALPRAAPAAALALKKLSADCGTLAAPLAADIVHAAQSERARDDAWVRRQLLEAAGASLIAASPEEATPLLRSLAASLLTELQRQAQQPTKGGGGCEAGATLLMAMSPRCTTIVRRDLATSLWDILLPALPPFAAHELLVPPLFVILKEAVTSLMDECLPTLPEICRLTLQALETLPCPSGVDLVRLIVLIFHADWAGCGEFLRTSTRAIAAICASDASGRCDLTEALFVALQAITRKRPAYLDVLDDLLPHLVELGCNSIRLWEEAAARAACGWLAALAAARPHALRHIAPALTAAALGCIGGATPRNQVEPLAELLLALNRARWAEGALADWLRRALSVADFPTPHATDDHKRRFIAAVVKEKSSKRRLLATVQEFSLVCRGLMGTEYARQTLASKQLVS